MASLATVGPICDIRGGSAPRVLPAWPTVGLPWRHTPAVTDIAARDRRLTQWERRTATPLLILAVLFLFLLTVPVVNQHLPRVARNGLRVADVLIWSAFTVDYVVRLRLAVQRK